VKTGNAQPKSISQNPFYLYISTVSLMLKWCQIK